MRTSHDTELLHYGVPGMKHFEHKFGKWQKQAQYAHGQEDPDKKERNNSAKKLKSYSVQRKPTRRELKNAEAERKAAEKKAEEERVRNLTHDELLKSTNPNDLYAKRNLLTTSEIRERTDRLRAEEELKRFVPEAKPETKVKYINGKKMIGDALQRAGTDLLTDAAKGVGKYAYKTALEALLSEDAAKEIIKFSNLNPQQQQQKQQQKK